MLERPDIHPGSSPAPQSLSDHDPACDSCAVPSEALATPPKGWRRAFVVEGLDCAEEVATLRRAVGPLVGGESISPSTSSTDA